MRSAILLFSFILAATGSMAGGSLGSDAGASSAPFLGVEGKGDCGGDHWRGDNLVCYVTFAGPTNFSKVQVVFNMQGEKDPKDTGKFINFILRESRQLDPQTYEVTGEVPEETAAGTFMLAAIIPIGPLGSRVYENGYGFKSDRKVVLHTGPRPFSPSAKSQTEKDLSPSEFSGEPHPGWVSGLLPAGKDGHEDGKAISPAGRKGETSCEGKHTWGDHLTCYITFSGQPEFSQVYLDFELETPIPPGQSGLARDFLLSDSRLISPQNYEVSGIVTACLSGTYSVNSITAIKMDGSQARFTMESGPGIRSEQKVEVVLPTSSPFPEIKKIGELPPNE